MLEDLKRLADLAKRDGFTDQQIAEAIFGMGAVVIVEKESSSLRFNTSNWTLDDIYKKLGLEKPELLEEPGKNHTSANGSLYVKEGELYFKGEGSEEQKIYEG